MAINFLSNRIPYYMDDSARGHNETNSVLWLASRVPLGFARFDPRKKG